MVLIQKENPARKKNDTDLMTQGFLMFLHCSFQLHLCTLLGNQTGCHTLYIYKDALTSESDIQD